MFVDALIATLLLAGIYALMSQGLALIFGVAGVLNLAHGELFVAGAYLTWVLQGRGLPPWSWLPLTVVAGLILGWVLGRTIIAPLVERPPLGVLLTTFGLALLIQAALRVAFTATPRFVRTALGAEIFEIAGFAIPANKLLAAFMAIALMGLLIPAIRHTRYGKAMRAVSQNTEGARIVGVDLPMTHAVAMSWSTALTMTAGSLYGMIQAFSPFTSTQFTLRAFIIVVVAGVGRWLGLLAAATLLAGIEVFAATYIPGHGTGIGLVLAFSLVAVVLAIRPTGLGRREAEARV